MRTWHKIWCEFTQPEGDTETVPFMGRTRDTALANAETYLITYMPAGSTCSIIREDILYTGAGRERKVTNT